MKKFDVKRLDKKIGMIDKDNFDKLADLLNLNVLPHNKVGASPEGNCEDIIIQKRVKVKS